MLFSGQLNNGNPESPDKRHYIAGLDVRTLEPTYVAHVFDGSCDVLTWLEEFNAAFLSHRFSTVQNHDQRNELKGQLLRVYIVEPSRSRVLATIQQ